MLHVGAQIRKLRRELEAAHEKVNTLTTQLNTNVSSERSCLTSVCSHSTVRERLIIQIQCRVDDRRAY